MNSLYLGFHIDNTLHKIVVPSISQEDESYFDTSTF